MSCVIVVAPVLTAGWSVIAAAVAGAAAAAGFRVEQSQSAAGVTRVDMDVESSEILADAAASERIVIAAGGMRALFSRDERGVLKLCMEGASLTKEELRSAGRDLIDRVTQQFVYHRLVTELKRRHMTIVQEDVSANRTVRIRVRNP